MIAQERQSKFDTKDAFHNAVQFALPVMMGYSMSRHLATKKTNNCCTKGRER
jgi:hypothetical protein